MATQANIVVKKNDGTTDVTYTAVVPSSGDRTPARWLNQAVGTALQHRPSLKHVSRDNGDGTARRHEFTFTYPQLSTDSGTGVTKVERLVTIGGFAVVPTEMPSTDVNEAIAQGFNLFASAHFKANVQSGFAPT